MRPKGTSNATAPGLLFQLVKARQAHNLSQAAAGALIGKSPSHYGKIERGLISLEARAALILCNRLGLTLAELLESKE